MRPEVLALSQAAVRLRAADAVAWDEFVAAFATYTSVLKDACVSSPIPELQVSQGRAQECARLYKTLLDAPQSVEQTLRRNR